MSPEKKIDKPKTPYLNDNGHEVLSSTPMAPPIGYKKQPSMVEHVRNMVRSELLRQTAERQGFESFEDAEDFDTPDDPPDPSTPYEAVFDPPLPREEATPSTTPDGNLPSNPARTPPEGGAADTLATPPVASPPKKL